MDLNLRAGTADDLKDCGRVCFDAFHAIATGQGFPPDFASPSAATDVLSRLVLHSGFSFVVAELDGRIVGSNVLDERSPVCGVGPLSVDPTCQNQGIGRRLMLEVLDRAADIGAVGVRLLHASYHNRTLALYTQLGFTMCELVACLEGALPVHTAGDHHVRPATVEDLPACDALCRTVHGFARTAEVVAALTAGQAIVVERAGHISGYSTGHGFLAHAVGENDEDLKALISAADRIDPPGILVPVTGSALFPWCLGHGLRIVYTFNLMAAGMYTAPRGSYQPSALY